MTTASTNLPSAKKAILSQHAQLESLVAIATRHFNDQILGVTGRLVGVLLDVGQALEAKEVFQRVKSGNLLKDNSYAYLHLAATELELALRRELELLVPSLKKARPAAAQAAVELSLVPYEEMDSRMAFDAIARPFEFRYADRIANLNLRLGVMLERDILRTSQNPFRPDVLLGVLHRAWCEFEPDSASHALLLPLLKPELLFDFAPMYDALCDALAGKGAGDALQIRKTESAAAARQARAKQKADLARQLRKFLDEEPEGAADLGIPLIPDLPQAAGSGGWRPSGAAGFQVAPSQARPRFESAGAAAAAPAARFESGGAAGADHAQLLDLLKSLQARLPEQPPAAGGAAAKGADVFYLPRLKDSIPKGSLSRADEGTIDLLSKVFEAVFIDPNLSAETRELMQFLQIPVLRAALADKNFFYEDAHPARRMIDLMSRLGLEERRTPDDPLYQAMRRSVDKVGREVDGEGDRQSAAFTEALADLEQSVRQDEEVAEQRIAAPIAAALRQEKAVAASRSAKTAVAARIGSGQVVAMLETFLEDKWTAVLTLAYTVEDEKPGAVGNATRTMDDLIWSVKPKITREERRALVARLPGLLAALNRWLDVIKWQDEARTRFFAELAECHASIVRAPLDITPERQLEIAVEVAQQDALRRLEKEQAAAQAVPADVDDALLAIEALERGQWLEFAQPDGTPRKVKLAWISPLRTLFIFSTATRQEAFSVPVEKLQAAFREQRVRVLRVDGVVGRALSAAMQGAGNDPAMPGHQAA